MLFDFTVAYNRQSWISFFKTSFLHEDFATSDEPVSFDFKPNYLSDPVRFLGTSSALDLNVYEMHRKTPGTRVWYCNDQELFNILDDIEKIRSNGSLIKSTN